MQDWLNHPAVESGLAPFLAALVTAELLQRLRLSGLAILAGFSVTVYLASNFSIDPLTGPRKIVWIGLAAGALGVLFSRLQGPSWRYALCSVAAAAAIWTIWTILQHQPVSIALQWAAACALYAGWLVFWMDGMQNSPVHAGSAGVALGMGTGGAALLGGSALLGQFGLALGAASGAFLLIQMVSNRPLPCGRSFTLPLAMISGLCGSLAVLTTQLPWYALGPLALIPLSVLLRISEKRAVWVQSLILATVTGCCAAGALYLTWRVAGAPPF